MGEGYAATCRPCGYEIQVMLGAGTQGVMERCEQCGRSRLRRVDELDGEVRCECGGLLAADAEPRCPACGSADLVPTGVEFRWD